MDRVVRGQTNKLDDKYESFPFLVAKSIYSFSGNSSLSPRFSVTPQILSSHWSVQMMKVSYRPRKMTRVLRAWGARSSIRSLLRCDCLEALKNDFLATRSLNPCFSFNYLYYIRPYKASRRDQQSSDWSGQPDGTGICS